jgi:hypothetical protein
MSATGQRLTDRHVCGKGPEKTSQDHLKSGPFSLCKSSDEAIHSAPPSASITLAPCIPVPVRKRAPLNRSRHSAGSTSSLSWKSHSITAGDMANFLGDGDDELFHDDNLIWSDEIAYTLITSENVRRFTQGRQNRLAASGLLGAQTRCPAAMSCGMPAGRRSPTSTPATTRPKRGRQRCSLRTRLGGSPSTSRGCWSSGSRLNPAAWIGTSVFGRGSRRAFPKDSMAVTVARFPRDP